MSGVQRNWPVATQEQDLLQNLLFASASNCVWRSPEALDSVNGCESSEAHNKDSRD